MSSDRSDRSSYDSFDVPFHLSSQCKPWGKEYLTVLGLPAAFSNPINTKLNCQPTLPLTLLYCHGTILTSSQEMKIQILALPLSSCVNCGRFTLNLFQASDPSYAPEPNKQDQSSQPPTEFCRDG